MLLALCSLLFLLTRALEDYLGGFVSLAADVDALLGIVYADALEVGIFGFVGIGIDVGDTGLDVAGGGEGVSKL